MTFRIDAQPEHGTLSGFDRATGAVTYTSNADFNGLDQFTFVAIDEAGLESEPATIYLRVDPVNDPAQVQGLELETDDETPVVVDLWQLAQDVETPDELLTFELGDAVGGTTELLDDAHTVVFTPEPGYDGEAWFTYSVTDTGDGCNPETDECDGTELFSEPITVGPVTVTILVDGNDAPVCESFDVETPEDQPINVALRCEDPEGEAWEPLIFESPSNGWGT